MVPDYSMEWCMNALVQFGYMSSGITVQSRPERILTLDLIVTRAPVHIQLASLAFIPGLWPDFLYGDFLKFFVWLRLAFYGQAFRMIFYVLTGITSSVSLMTSLQLVVRTRMFTRMNWLNKMNVVLVTRGRDEG
jgi:hypothetical protein